MPRGIENVIEPPTGDDQGEWEKFLAQDVGPAELGEDPGKKALQEQAGISDEKNPRAKEVRHAIQCYYVLNETAHEGAHLQKAQELAKDSGLIITHEMMREIEDEVTDVRQEALGIAERAVRERSVLAFRTLALSTKIRAVLQEQYSDFDEQALEGIAEETAMRFTAGSSKY